MKKIKTAVVGCGSISDIYMTNLTNGKFTVMELVACSDLMVDRMNASAAKFGVKAMSLDEICADPEIELVICLTTPAALPAGYRSVGDWSRKEESALI